MFWISNELFFPIETFKNIKLNNYVCLYVIIYPIYKYIMAINQT